MNVRPLMRPTPNRRSLWKLDGDALAKSRPRQLCVTKRVATGGIVLMALGLSACTALATGPSWTRVSLADTAPERIAAEDARLVAEAAARAREPKSIGAKHILIMHDKSERKPPEIHRTREEAKKRSEECLAKVRAGVDFDKLVVEYTDEPGGVERKGDLSTFEKKTMVKAFGDAAFALEVGQVSNVVETPFGFHIIKRTE